MLFLFCCIAYPTPFPLPTTEPIIWCKQTDALTPLTGLTHLQIIWITDTDVSQAALAQFNSEFKSYLTWEETKEFRSIIYGLLTDIVRGTRREKRTLAEENKHPLSHIYERVLQARNTQLELLSGREEQRA